MPLKYTVSTFKYEEINRIIKTYLKSDHREVKDIEYIANGLKHFGKALQEGCIIGKNVQEVRVLNSEGKDVVLLNCMKTSGHEKWKFKANEGQRHDWRAIGEHVTYTDTGGWSRSAAGPGTPKPQPEQGHMLQYETLAKWPIKYSVTQFTTDEINKIIQKYPSDFSIDDEKMAFIEYGLQHLEKAVNTRILVGTEMTEAKIQDDQERDVIIINSQGGSGSEKWRFMANKRQRYDWVSWFHLPWTDTTHTLDTQDGSTSDIEAEREQKKKYESRGTEEENTKGCEKNASQSSERAQQPLTSPVMPEECPVDSSEHT